MLATRQGAASAKRFSGTKTTSTATVNLTGVTSARHAVCFSKRYTVLYANVHKYSKRGACARNTMSGALWRSFTEARVCTR